MRSSETLSSFDAAEYASKKINPGMVDVVMKWVAGVSFGEIIESCDIYEGTMIRVIRRLEELVRELIL